MARRKFTREFKISAVKLVNEQGYTISEAAKSLGVDDNSVRYWIKQLASEPGLAPTGDGALAAEIQRLRKENARLLLERENLKKSGRVLCQGASVKFRFIDQHLQQFPVEAVCEVLRVSRSGYYAWRGRPRSNQEARREELARKIQAVHQQSRRVYGSPRVCKALQAEGQRVCENTVARVMRQQGIRAKTKKTFVPRTTESLHEQPVAENLLNREFTADRPNQKWVTDITYIPTDEGWLYLAGVMDLFSRKIVGWSMAEHLRTDLVSEALRMAIARRQPGAGLLHHSDRGIQYASDAYQQLLQAHRMEASMSRRGDCWDNACAESFWGTLKTELVNHEHYASRDAARQSIFEYIEVFYNRNRLHSSLGYQSPEAFEASLN
ncbi:MAG TPA: IS3 family transposase [Chloroflexota bacterium]|nr:IS3 family transposase [Chloroflexota bacterium]